MPADAYEVGGHIHSHRYRFVASSFASQVGQISSFVPRLTPAAKVGIWAFALLAATAVSVLIASVGGSQFSLLNKNGGTVALTLMALVGLLAIVASEKRPFAEYGLVADRHWFRRTALGVVLGGLFYLAYLVFSTTAGVFEINADWPTIGRIGKTMLSSLAAIPLAAVQQVIFAGLLVGLLRNQTGRFAAMFLPAALFGIAVSLGCDGGLMSADGRRLAIGMTLLAALLGGLRLATGSVMMPAGLLAGALIIRRATSKLRLLEYNAENELADWLAPSADPRQGIVFAVTLGAACLGVIVLLNRRGEKQLEADPVADAQFKRLMPFSNLLTFIPLDRWAVLLAGARFRIDFIYIPRLVVTLIGSAIGTLLALPERLLAPIVLRHRVPDPVFVVGIHRSGTTHLHNLLSLDSQFRAPRNYEVFNPLGFLTGWVTTLLMTPALMWKRPMDSVQMTPFTSQEEEFALAAMGAPSPYNAFCLPRESDEHWRFMHADGFNEAELSRWQRAYNLLLRKLTFWTRKTPLLKNPANTGRISLLKQLYPNAKFIYLVRDPEAVYRSNKHFAKQGLVVFQLQEPNEHDNYATNFLENYRQISEAAERDLEGLEPGKGIRVRFEDIEANPAAVVSEIYESLGLEMTFEFRQRLSAYIKQNAGYRKNKPTRLPADEADAVRSTMADFYATWGYDNDDSVRDAA